MIPYRLGSVVVCVIGILLVLFAPSHAAETLSKQQHTEIERIIERYLLDNPDFMLEVLRRVTRYQEEQEAKRVRDSLVRHSDDLYGDPNSVKLGDPGANVTIVEFFDYRCGYCKRNHPIVTAFREQNRDVNVIYKEFPILGPESVFASRAAIAARKQGKYWDFHDALMSTRGKLTERHVLALAKEVGLDLVKLRRDIGTPEIDQVIQSNHRLAQALGINGTPGFVIGDNVVPGFLSTERLALAVDQARAGCRSC